jgi:hypothetical protein
MLLHQKRAAGSWALLGALVVSMGCAARAPVHAHSEDEPGPSSRPGTWPRDTQFFMLNSQEDTENHYLSIRSGELMPPVVSRAYG